VAKSQRDKGARNECALVNTLKAAGLAAERVPLSGAAGGTFAGDIIIPTRAGQFKIEAKLRGDGFKELYKWIEGNHAVIVRADRKEALAVLRIADFIELFKVWRDHAFDRADTLPPAAIAKEAIRNLENLSFAEPKSEA
jgi:hypothetical protein